MAKWNQRGLHAACGYLDSWLSHKCVQLALPGIQLSIRAAGKEIYRGAAGYADLRRKTKMKPNHLLRVASHSKTFSAVLALLLEERRILSCNDRVVDYIPEVAAAFSGYWRNVRIIDLLTHNSGLYRDSMECAHWTDRDCFPSAADIVKEIARARFVLRPNTQFKYSNIAYALLGTVFERAAGAPFASLVDRYIIKPGGLRDTSAEITRERTRRCARPYASRDSFGNRIALPHLMTRGMAAATGFCSTTSDLARFYESLFLPSRGLLTAKSRRKMMKTPYSVARRKSCQYGLGIIAEKIATTMTLGHSGGFQGFQTKTIFIPTERCTISVGINSIEGDPREILTSLIHAINFFCEHSRSSKHASVQRHRRFLGRYRSIWSVIDIIAIGTALFKIDPDCANLAESAVRLQPMGTTLRLLNDDGFGMPGECLRYDFSEKGDVLRIQSSGAIRVPERRYSSVVESWSRK